MITFRPLAVSWPRRTSLTMPTYPLRGFPSFIIMTCVPIHGTLSVLHKESSAFNVDGLFKKGTVANFNQLIWKSYRCKIINGSVYMTWYQDETYLYIIARP